MSRRHYAFWRHTGLRALQTGDFARGRGSSPGAARRPAIQGVPIPGLCGKAQNRFVRLALRLQRSQSCAGRSRSALSARSLSQQFRPLRVSCCAICNRSSLASMLRGHQSDGTRIGRCLATLWAYLLLRRAHFGSGSPSIMESGNVRPSCWSRGRHTSFRVLYVGNGNTASRRSKLCVIRLHLETYVIVPDRVSFNPTLKTTEARLLHHRSSRL